MEIKKIYVNDNEKGTLICDKCGKTRVVNLSDFKNIGKPLKVKCSCGHFFFVSIEVRKFYRKNTRLHGQYIKVSNDASKGLEKGTMIVEDLSRTGLGFRTKTQHNLRVKVGRPNRLSAVDRFLDSNCQSRFSDVRWRHIFNEKRFIQGCELRAILIFQ